MTFFKLREWEFIEYKEKLWYNKTETLSSLKSSEKSMRLLVKYKVHLWTRYQRISGVVQLVENEVM